MKVIGLIAEYNPFHNGHLYHINKIKENYPDSILVLVLNGYFMQRGESSILTKEEKTKISLHYGINIVLELPFVYGVQSADNFAQASIELLNNLKVERIIFGSETDDIKVLEQVAKTQLNNKEYDLRVKEYLKKGINYPTAVSLAINTKDNISRPNDLLGISYIKAILKNRYKIKYETIKRTNDYHDINSKGKTISASNIRNKLNKNKSIKKYVPSYSYKFIKNINTNYFNYLKYKIITEPKLENYLDVDEGIENRLKNKILTSNSLDEFITKVKTKRYTYNKINRMFIHILIGLTKKDNNKMKLDYIKILGFDSIGQEYLNKIKKNIKLPLYNNKLNSKIKDYELKASLIYDLINNNNTYKFEIKNKPVTKK